jgi:dihydrofolate reductase
VEKIIIAAVAKNRVIGNNGKMPWHIPEDLQHFKQITTGHTVLMGRKTFESIGHPLPHRRNIILTSKPILGVETFPSLDDAFHALASEEKIFIIGGGAVFAQTLVLADEFYLTLIEQDFIGDTFFPDYEYLLKQRFSLMEKDVRNGFRFVHYTKQIS